MDNKAKWGAIPYIPIDLNCFRGWSCCFDDLSWREAESTTSMHLCWAELMLVNYPSNRCHWLCVGTSSSRLQNNTETNEIQNKQKKTTKHFDIVHIVSHRLTLPNRFYSLGSFFFCSVNLYFFHSISHFATVNRKKKERQTSIGHLLLTKATSFLSFFYTNQSGQEEKKTASNSIRLLCTKISIDWWCSREDNNIAQNLLSYLKLFGVSRQLFWALHYSTFLLFDTVDKMECT